MKQLLTSMTFSSVTSSPGHKLKIILLLLVVHFATNTFAQESPVFKWAKKVLKPSSIAGIQNIITTSDQSGNVYAMGSFYGTADYDPGPGVFNLSSNSTTNDDVFLVKLDDNANFVWAVSQGHAVYPDYSASINVDVAGNVFTTTYYQSASSTYSTVISKFDPDGGLLWSNVIPAVAVAGKASTLDSSGNLLVTGGFKGTIDFDPGAGVYELASNGVASGDLCVFKFDTDGNLAWAKGTGGTGGELGTSIITDDSGNIIVTGLYAGTDPADFNPDAGVATLTCAGSTDVFVLKLDGDGNFIWARSMGGTAAEQPNSIAVNGSGNIFLTGYFEGEGDYDPGAGVANLTPFSSGTSDIFLMRLNADGTFGWAYGFGEADDDEGRAITTDVDGNLIFTGFFNFTVDFDPGPGVHNLVSAGQNLYPNMFIAKLDEDAGLIWAQEIIGVNNSTVIKSNAIKVDDAGDISLGGIFWGTADFDFGLCTTSLGNNPYAAFAMKIKTGDPGPPTITSVEPSSGAVGTPVVITGTHFSSVPSENDLRWTSNKAAVISESTPNSITTTVPTGAVTGKISLKVGCYPLAMSADDFIVGALPVPTITSFTPTSGLVGVGVTITGTNFSATPGDNTVNFNGTPAVVTASTATSITTTVPVGATTGKITVTVGGNTATSATDFTVTVPALPTIISFTPPSGIVGSDVTITGTNFSATPGDNTVNFNGTPAVVTASTATSITTTVPVGATTGKVTVTVGDNTATSATDFTVTVPALPTIISFTPPSGIVGSDVTITGTNFNPTPGDNIVEFNGTASVVTASTATSITTTVPVDATTGKITVTVDGNTATSATDFTVLCALMPAITSFTPAFGPAGTSVIISGSNFSTTPADNQVQINGANAVVTSSTATTINATVPAEAAGTGSITVTIACNTATSADDFTVCPPKHTITSFSPESGAVGELVTIMGTDFSSTPSDNAVDFNGTPAVVTASSATSITTTVPDGAATGPINVGVGCYVVSTDTEFIVVCNTCDLEIAPTSLTTEPEGTVVIDLLPLITTSGILDVASIKVSDIPPSGALATIQNGVLTVDYTGIAFSGNETITVEACNTNGICASQEISIEVAGQIVVYNGISPNDDNKNAIFRLQFIDVLPTTKTNKVTIYNRWGDEVFSASNYDNKTSVFTGLTNDGNKLPAGVYYYKIHLPDQGKTLTGFLSLRY